MQNIYLEAEEMLAWGEHLGLNLVDLDIKLSFFSPYMLSHSASENGADLRSRAERENGKMSGVQLVLQASSVGVNPDMPGAIFNSQEHPRDPEILPGQLLDELLPTCIILRTSR
eukprot:115187-Hanusia_phi.AAC.3